jgi:hypothetical protein
MATAHRNLTIVGQEKLLNVQLLELGITLDFHFKNIPPRRARREAREMQTTC